MEGLANAAGHEDRHAPLKNYCKGLLLPGERKSIEPMAARLDSENVQPMRQSLHHLVAKAPWSDETLLEEVRNHVLPAMQKQAPVVAWIVDDTGFPKKGTHSVVVARQYCGQVGKQDNCRVAVSLSVSTRSASLPIAWRLYLPQEWADDKARRKQAGVPEDIQFETKPAIALQQIRAAVEQDVPRAPVLADAAYGTDTRFREAVTALKLHYVVGVMSSVSVWKPGEAPLSKREWKGTGRRTKLLQRNGDHHPVTIKELARGLAASAWKTVTWRPGTKHSLRSRFAAVRIRPAHREYWRSEPHPEEWLLIEWPRGEAEPAKYWLSTLPTDTKLGDLVRLAKQRWIIERDYQELNRNSAWGTLRGEAGVVFIIMPLSAFPLTAS